MTTPNDEETLVMEIRRLTAELRSARAALAELQQIRHDQIHAELYAETAANKERMDAALVDMAESRARQWREEHKPSWHR